MTMMSPAELLAPEAGLHDALRWAVAHAVLAPSDGETQPWSFRARVDADAGTAEVELWMHREAPEHAVVACGGALLNLRLALRGAELGSSVRLCPDPAVPNLLARVRVRGHTTERPADLPLREAIWLRSSGFAPGELPASFLDHLVAEGAYEGALVDVVDDDPALLVIGSAGQDRASLLRAGAGLERVLLAAAASGFAGELVDVGVQELGRRVGLDHPQAVLHLGPAEGERIAQRPPVDEVLTVTDLLTVTDRDQGPARRGPLDRPGS